MELSSALSAKALGHESNNSLVSGVSYFTCNRLIILIFPKLFSPTGKERPSVLLAIDSVS